MKTHSSKSLPPNHWICFYVFFIYEEHPPIDGPFLKRSFFVVISSPPSTVLTMLTRKGVLAKVERGEGMTFMFLSVSWVIHELLKCYKNYIYINLKCYKNCINLLKWCKHAMNQQTFFHWPPVAMVIPRLWRRSGRCLRKWHRNPWKSWGIYPIFYWRLGGSHSENGLQQL